MAAERAHLLRLLAWGASSAVSGLALLAWIRWRGSRAASLLFHFALQTALWGTIDLLIASASFRGLELRDLDSATGLDRFLWLNIGLDAGYVMVGLTLIIVAWRLGRRQALMGAGLGVAVQGAALALLDLVFAVQIVR